MPSLAQFDASYDPKEDRVLLRVTNTDSEEYRMWLTRRLVYSILTELKANTSAYRISQPITRPQMAAFQDESAEAVARAHVSSAETVLEAELEQQAKFAEEKFDTQFKPGEKLPMGDGGYLVSKVNFTPNASAEGTHSLSFHSAEGQGVTIAVSIEFFNSIFEILERVSKVAAWDFVAAPAIQTSTVLQ